MKRILLILSCQLLSGCFVGQFFGADYQVKVNNHTDKTIKAYPNGDVIGDSVYRASAEAIRKNESSIFVIDGFEYDPNIRVEYNGVKRDYDVDYDWLGYDEINVEKFHFVNANG